MRPLERAMCFWFMLLLIGLLAATPIASAADNAETADEVVEMLNAAKQKHATTAKEISGQFTFSLGEKIKYAAAAGDLESVKKLIAFKESFEASGGIPADPDVAEDALRYVSARKASASLLFNAYQSAISNYTMKLQVREATALDTELKQFVAAEKQALIIGVPQASATTKEGLPAKPARTKESFFEWYQKYIEMMDSVANEPTTVKKENTHREFVKRIDERLKHQVWTFHCRITNVKEKDGRVTIQFDPPDELPGMNENWQCIKSTSSLKFSKQRALDLVPDDILVITGTPRFTATVWGFSGPTFLTRSLRIGDQGVSHNLVITKFRHAVRKQSSDALVEID